MSLLPLWASESWGFEIVRVSYFLRHWNTENLTQQSPHCKPINVMWMWQNAILCHFLSSRKVPAQRAIKLNTEPQASTTRHFSSEKANKNNYSRSVDFPFSFYDAVQKLMLNTMRLWKVNTNYHGLIRKNTKSIGSLIILRKNTLITAYEQGLDVCPKRTCAGGDGFGETLCILSLSPSLSVSQITRALKRRPTHWYQIPLMHLQTQNMHNSTDTFLIGEVIEIQSTCVIYTQWYISWRNSKAPPGTEDISTQWGVPHIAPT